MTDGLHNQVYPPTVAFRNRRPVPISRSGSRPEICWDAARRSVQRGDQKLQILRHKMAAHQGHVFDLRRCFVLGAAPTSFTVTPTAAARRAAPRRSPAARISTHCRASRSEAEHAHAGRDVTMTPDWGPLRRGRGGQRRGSGEERVGRIRRRPWPRPASARSRTARAGHRPWSGSS